VTLVGPIAYFTRARQRRLTDYSTIPKLASVRLSNGLAASSLVTSARLPVGGHAITPVFFDVRSQNLRDTVSGVSVP
jgi:hypothetical protein